MAETVRRVTYARVAAGIVPNAATERQHDEGLDTFLLEHVRQLRGFASGKTACPAVFLEADDSALFEQLRTGSKDAFLDAARQLTIRLVGKMNGTTAPGLLVCVQVEDEGTNESAAVLKLQVVTPNAANLELLDTGEELLSAVKDVMDAPGKLQKGALVQDERPGSDVIMGDVASTEAQYFPSAFGISIEQRASLAAVDTLAEIRQVCGPTVESAVREALPEIPSGNVIGVLESVGERVPALADAATRKTIEDRLAARPRPVRRISTDVPLTEYVVASGITIKAPITGENRVSWKRNDTDGGYDINIHVDEEPRRDVRRA